MLFVLFLSYRLKSAKNVKAEFVNVDNIKEIAATFAGTARVVEEGEECVLKIATFDGILEARCGQWIVRHDDSVEVMDHGVFTEKYERARTGLMRDN